MNVTLTSLEALILKATHETLPCPDAAALEAFCTIMKDSPEGPQLAVQALAARIHSHNPREAMLALIMLDRCMRRSDNGFHAEVGKFRFLNEMIKLVSPKYFADRTAPEVRTRVLQLLHAWSIEYPKESKFKVAYDMLKNQGVIKETPPPLPPEETTPLKARSKNAIFEDEEKSKLLQKLLQSKKPEDLQHANRLIKTMVREEERRNEASSRLALEVSAALDSAGLLRDMLAAGGASADEEQLIAELHASCGRLRPALQRLAADASADNLADILRANDLLDEVFEQYKAFVASKEKAKSEPLPPVSAPKTNTESLLDFAGAPQAQENGGKTQNVIDELGDIFASESTSSIAELLKPVSLIPNEEVDLMGEKPKAEGWNELDSLGEQLLKQSLPESSKRLDSTCFTVKSTKKIPMNALEKSPKKETKLLDNGALLDLDFFTKKPEEKSSPAPASPTPDDVMVDITDGATSHNNDSPLDSILDLGLDDNKKCDSVETMTDREMEKGSAKKPSEVKSLSDINTNLSLQNVKPSKVPPMTVYEEEEGLTVVLHFCKDKPRPDVNVIVVSTTSRHSSPIEDYKFQGVVPKGCKIRLLPPSGTCLPASLPFVPPPALTQLLLLARPPGFARVSLKCVLTYTCDGETCSEIREVDALPLDEI